MNTSNLQAPCPETGTRCTPRCPKFVVIDGKQGGCAVKVAADVLILIATMLQKKGDNNADSKQD